MLDKEFHIARKLLNKFTTISLSEMDDVRLMDRTVVKFILPINRLEPVIKELSEHYKVLTINGLNTFTYRTDYYDTPDLDMYFDHHNGKLNRFKIRHREYIESNTSFLEVKFKSNKGRVTKDRINSNIADQEGSGFIHKHTPYNPNDLTPTLNNRFNRFTLVDNGLQERVTVDFNLSFTDNVHNIRLGGLVIIEVKQKSTDNQRVIFSVLKSHAIRPVSISKYCLGISMLYTHEKLNHFKKTILMIKKISNVELSA
jgi:hypothetical protein